MQGIMVRIAIMLGRHVLLVNQYGPTECTLTSTYYCIRIPPSDPPSPLADPFLTPSFISSNGAWTPCLWGLPGKFILAGLAWHGVILTNLN